MKRLLALLFLLIATPTAAQNPQCPTRPLGDNTNACASTAFVIANGGGNAITALTGDVTATGPGSVAATIAANAVTNAKAAQAAANTMKGNWTGSTANVADNAMPSCTDTGGNHLNYVSGTGITCGTSGASSTGTLVSIVTYSSTQTITIPATATQAFIRMWGGSGGSGGVSTSSSGGTGAAGYLEKTLTGLTPGNTLAFTRGAAGAAGAATPTSGGNGTASTLASGSQTITTLTANGSNGSASGSSGSPSGSTSGGTATNGDLNVTGASGQDGVVIVVSGSAVTSTGAAPGMNSFASGAYGVAIGTGTLAGNAGVAGGMVIMWFK